MFQFLLLTFTIATCSLSHDIQVAILKIYRSDATHVKMELKVERDDLARELQSEDKSVVFEYIKENIQLTLNNNLVHYQLDTIIETPKHLTITTKCKFGKDINQLSLTNTFLNSLENHSNIIQIRLKENERDFLMNDQRTVIKVEL